MSKSIEVVVSPEGEITISAVGFKGQGCTKATEALEKAMGVAGKRKKSPEYYQESATSQTIGK